VRFHKIYSPKRTSPKEDFAPATQGQDTRAESSHCLRLHYFLCRTQFREEILHGCGVATGRCGLSNNLAARGCFPFATTLEAHFRDGASMMERIASQTTSLRRAGSSAGCCLWPTKPRFRSAASQKSCATHLQLSSAGTGSFGCFDSKCCFSEW